jgi:uncharacterized membrane protein
MPAPALGRRYSPAQHLVGVRLSTLQPSARKQGIGKSEVVLLPNRSTNLAGKTRAVPGYWVQLVDVVAFIALLGVVAIMVSAVATNLGDLFLALASVFVLAFSGWFVVAHLTSRRR